MKNPGLARRLIRHRAPVVARLSGADVTPFVGLAGSLKRWNASEVAGLAAFLIAAAALIGWWAELPLLSSWGTGLAPATPLGALCLAALAIALACSGPARRFTEQ